MTNPVSINQGSAQLLKTPRNKTFAAGDATGQTDDQHKRTRLNLKEPKRWVQAIG